MRILALLLLFCAISAEAQYSSSFTITVGTQPTAVSSFVVKVFGTYSQFGSTANGGCMKNANGWDVAFYSDAAHTQALAYSLVSWTATGVIEWDITVPGGLSTSSSEVIYGLCGNASISTNGSTAVLAGQYTLVVHGDATASMADATGVTGNGSNVNLTAITGKIGYGLSNTSTTAVGATFPSHAYTTGNFTVEAWVNRDWPTDASATYPELYETSNYGSGSGSSFLVESCDNAGAVWWIGNGYNNAAPVVIGPHGEASSFTSGTWHHFAATTSASATTLYVDGVAQTPSTVTVAAFPSETVGLQAFCYNNNSAAIQCDEVRFSNQALSAAQIAADYANQNSPSTFYTVSGLTSISATPPVALFF